MVSSLPPTSMISRIVDVPDLSLISSSLNGSFASSTRRRRSIDDAARKPLRALDDLLHPLFEVGQILRGERPVDLEVVVEAVLDRRADAEFRVRELLLHGLGQHVRGRVPDHAAPVLGSAGTGSTSAGSAGIHARSRSRPSPSRTTTIACGPVPAARPHGRRRQPLCPPGPSRSAWARWREGWTRGLLVVQTAMAVGTARNVRC